MIIWEREFIALININEVGDLINKKLIWVIVLFHRKSFFVVLSFFARPPPLDYSDICEESNIFANGHTLSLIFTFAILYIVRAVPNKDFAKYPASSIFMYYWSVIEIIGRREKRIMQRYIPKSQLPSDADVDCHCSSFRRRRHRNSRLWDCGDGDYQNDEKPSPPPGYRGLCGNRRRRWGGLNDMHSLVSCFLGLHCLSHRTLDRTKFVKP